MLKKTRFYIGLTLIVQSVTFIVLAIILFVKQRKNFASIMLGVGAVGGIAGAYMIFRQLRRVIEDERILEAMDELLGEEDLDFCPYHKREIPVDDTADETEFNGH